MYRNESLSEPLLTVAALQELGKLTRNLTQSAWDKAYVRVWKAIGRLDKKYQGLKKQHDRIKERFEREKIRRELAENDLKYQQESTDRLLATLPMPEDKNVR
jgi:hypothetical protein